MVPWSLLLPSILVATGSQTAYTDVEKAVNFFGKKESVSEVLLDILELTDEKHLREWLKSLDITIPQIKVKGATVQGECKNLDLRDLRASEANGNLTLGIKGLALTCNIDAAIGPFQGGIDLEIEETTLEMSLAFMPDGGKPPLPKAIVQNNCDGNIKLSKPIEIDILGKKVDVSDLFTDPKFLCLAIHEAMSAVTDLHVLDKMDDKVRAMISEDHPPTFPVATSSEIYDLSNNIAITALENLLAAMGTKGNEANIGDLIHQALDGSTLNLTDKNVTPISIPRIPIGPAGALGHIGVTLHDMAITGLDSISNLKMGTPDPKAIDLIVGIDNIIANLSLTITVEPGLIGPIKKAGTLKESFKVGAALKNLGLGAGLWVGLNSTTLGAYDFLQLPQRGCLWDAMPDGLNVTNLNLSLPSIEFDLAAINGEKLERDLDQFITSAAKLLLVEYAGAVDGLGNWAAATMGKELATNALRHALMYRKDPESGQLERTVCGPPKPKYQSAALHNGGLYGSIALVGVAAVALMLVPFTKPGSSKKAPPPADVPGAAHALTADAQDPLGAHRNANVTAPNDAGPITAYTPDMGAQDGADPGDRMSLFRNTKMPFALRVALPMLVLANILLFISSNAGSGCQIKILLAADPTGSGTETPVVPLPPVFDFSLLNTLIDMYDAGGGVILLAFVIGFFSGVWPYAKLVMMMVCWLASPKVLSIHRRHQLLEFLDAFGKWSLIDTYVMVLFLVAFSFNLTCDQASGKWLQEMCEGAGLNAQVRIYVLPTIGFHSFLVATLLSLGNGLAMSTCHRYVHRIGEFSHAEEYEDEGGPLGNRRKLCNVLKSEGCSSRVHPQVVTGILGLSFVLAAVGVFMNSFRFAMDGVAKLALGSQADRAFGVWSLGTNLPPASFDPNTFGIHWIQFFFIVFSGVTVLIFLGLVLALWNLPLTVKGQRRLLVLGQVMNAWAGLDVFCVGVFACVIEIGSFADFILSDVGVDTTIDPIIKQVMPYFPSWQSMINGEDKMAVVNCSMCPGFILLCLAALLSTVVGNITLNKCGRALFSPTHRPLADSIAASFASTTGP